MQTDQDILALPRATTRNGVMPEDPSILSGDGFDLPDLFFRALRQRTALEETLVFKTTAPVRIQDVSTILRSRRFCRQVWFYGIASFSGTPALPVANVNPAYWGWSPQTLVNKITAWSGSFSQLLQPVDGEIIDLWSVWLAGSVNDGVFISVL